MGARGVNLNMPAIEAAINKELSRSTHIELQLPEDRIGKWVSAEKKHVRKKAGGKTEETKMEEEVRGQRGNSMCEPKMKMGKTRMEMLT